MRLLEHPDFEQAVLRAAEHFQSRRFRPAIIEKDYYVTEALRIVAATAGNKVTFKEGGEPNHRWIRPEAIDSLTPSGLVDPAN